MFATPAPASGGVVPGRDVPGRVLRVSSHADAQRVVVSLWQDGQCLATVRLGQPEVSDLIRALAGTLLVLDAPPSSAAG
jgi:hypothetical protein